jgi:hypothetical protein
MHLFQAEQQQDGPELVQELRREEQGAHEVRGATRLAPKATP